MLKQTLICCLMLIISCTPSKKEQIQNLKLGKKLAFTRSKGNCLACHVIEDGEFAGNIAPELKNISQRFKTKTKLQQFIWNAGTFNPETSMPPFGKNKILSENEINAIVNYLWQL